MPASSLRRCSGVQLVLESSLEDLGLGATVGATAGALNPLDFLVKGCQDCLQLRLEGVRLHFGIYIYHRALVLKCLCIDAVLKRNQNRVNNERLLWLYSFIFQSTKYSLELFLDTSVLMTNSMKTIHLS